MPAATKTKICAACGEPFEAKRSDAKACSDRCRKRLQRSSHADLVSLVPDRVPGVPDPVPLLPDVPRIPRVDPIDWETQMTRQGKLCDIFEKLTRAGMRVSAREFLAAASDPFLDGVAHFGGGPGWRFLRELVELAGLVERESDEERKGCA